MKKQKKDYGKIVSASLPFLMGGVCGLFWGKWSENFLEPYTTMGAKLFVFGILIAEVAVAYYVQIVAHEAGHLILGKLSGYEFISFRIGRLMFIKEDGKIKCKKYTVVGTGGQCIMMPTKEDYHSNPYVLYNLGGVVANSIISVICLGFYFSLPHMSLLSEGLMLTTAFGIIIGLLNGMPMKIGGVPNDGYNVIAIGKNQMAQKSLYIQLKGNGLMAKGTRIKDMPSQWFELPPDADLSNPLICSLGYLEGNHYQDRRDFRKAQEIYQILLEKAPGLVVIHRNEILCELLFFEIIGECRKAEIDRLYTKQLKKYIKATSLYLSRKRLLYAYALLVEGSQIEAQKQLVAFEKVAKNYPYQVEITNEREMLEWIDNENLSRRR